MLETSWDKERSALKRGVFIAGLNPENAATRAGRVDAWPITAGADARVIEAAATIVTADDGAIRKEWCDEIEITDRKGPSTRIYRQIGAWDEGWARAYPAEWKARTARCTCFEECVHHPPVRGATIPVSEPKLIAVLRSIGKSGDRAPNRCRRRRAQLSPCRPVLTNLSITETDPRLWRLQDTSYG